MVFVKPPPTAAYGDPYGQSAKHESVSPIDTDLRMSARTASSHTAGVLRETAPCSGLFVPSVSSKIMLQAIQSFRATFTPVLVSCICDTDRAVRPDVTFNSCDTWSSVAATLPKTAHNMSQVPRLVDAKTRWDSACRCKRIEIEGR